MVKRRIDFSAIAMLSSSGNSIPGEDPLLNYRSVVAIVTFAVFLLPNDLNRDIRFVIEMQ